MNLDNSYQENYVARNLLIECGIEPVLALDGLTEIAINSPERIFFDRGNDWEYIDVSKANYRNLELLAQSLAVSNSTGSSGHFNPIHSVTLPDGERGQIVLPPATLQGNISFTFRKPSKNRFGLDSYINSGRLSDFTIVDSIFNINNYDITPDQHMMMKYLKDRDMDSFFKKSVEMKLNHVTVGGTGSGKTSFEKAIVDLYPANKRYITIEDTHELDMPKHLNKVHLFYKEKGKGVTASQLIMAGMRMKPDHIFLTELRGEETWSYIEALNTGHNGSITSTHANSPSGVFSRLAGLIKASDVGQTLDLEFIMNTLRASIDIITFWDKTYMKQVYYNPEEKNEALLKLNGMSK